MLNLLGRFECVRHILHPGSALDLAAYAPLFADAPPFDWATTVDVYADLLSVDPAAAAGSLPTFGGAGSMIAWTAPDWSQVVLAWDGDAPQLTVRRPPAASAHAVAIQAVVEHRLSSYPAAACYFDDPWLPIMGALAPPGQRVLWLPGQAALYQAGDGDWLVTPAGLFADAKRDVCEPTWMAAAPAPDRQVVREALAILASWR